jgi:hypothetical protein
VRTRNSDIHEVEYVHGGIEWLDEIRPLWEKLNALHGELSPHFADSFRNGSFSKWMTREGAKKKRLLVAFGNDAALGFYEHFGFHPRNLELIQRNQT